jgi:hypothetical protein
MNLFLNEESIRYLVDYFSVKCDSEVSIYIPKETISLIANGLLLIMKLFANVLLLIMELFLNKRQLPYRLRRCLVGPSSNCHFPRTPDYRLTFNNSIQDLIASYHHFSRSLMDSPYFRPSQLPMKDSPYFRSSQLPMKDSPYFRSLYLPIYLPMKDPPNNWKRSVSVGSIDIPKEIILKIAEYLAYREMKALEVVCEGFFATIRPKWPSFQFTIIY